MAKAAKKSRHVRVAEDLADKLGDVLEVVDTSSASFLDPFIRPAICAAFEKHRDVIENLRKVREQSRQAGAQA